MMRDIFENLKCKYMPRKAIIKKMNGTPRKKIVRNLLIL